MQYIVPILFYVLGLGIHGVPALSALFPAKISKLYGISANDTVLMTLLQHRAVLFALVAAACIYAAHVSAARWPVLIGAVISMGSFMVIAVARGEQGGSLGKIVIVDGIGLMIAALLAALLIRMN
ncbi:hypothetical protein [Robiginitomaculum antarcticum]|uniref:hypothetical protein n=1 Tax=Robiginitomaculum antarcticum TaxID=437507 RepID=UPI000377BFE7|nr:hypothetical protein [Robiginitomaculum antarcticum]